MILLLIAFVSVFLMALAYHVFKYSKNSLFKVSLVSLIVCQILWQWYVGFLYSVDLMSKEQVEFLFRLFRIGALATPTVFFLTLTEALIHSKEQIPLASKIFTRRNAIIYGVITLIFYILNWTKLTVTDLNLVDIGIFAHYYPVYGPLGKIQFLQTLSLLVWLALALYVSIKMKNPYVKAFYLPFSIFASIASVLGLLNFTEGSMIFTTLMSGMLVTIGILHSFNEFREKVMEHERKIEVEKIKIDYVDYATSSLIHEIRNPLTVLQGYFQLINMNESLDEDAKRMLDILNKSSRHIQSVVDNFVDFVNTKEIVPQRESLNEVIEYVIEMMQVRGQEQDVEIYPLEADKEIYVMMDSSKFAQVLINLYKNAIEAMKKAERTKEICTSISIYANEVKIEIRDTGKGIPPHIAENIFKPFKTDKEGGMGLGLSISQNIVSAHKGTIGVKETSKAGTTFVISLPIEDYSELFA